MNSNKSTDDIEMRDSDLGLRWVLRCILWHVAPLLITKCESQSCVLPLHKPALQSTNAHTHTHIHLHSFSLFVCCLIQLFVTLSNTHTMIFEFPLLCPQPSHQQRQGLPLLFVQFTLVGRQCSRAVTNETHSSSIPLLIWYHTHR